MAPSNPKHIVALFLVFGSALGLFFPFLFGEWIFYTTKPFHFVNNWMIFASGPVFGLSIGTIPFVLAAVQYSVIAASYRVSLLIYSSIWVAVAALTSVLVSLLTATIHHRTLSIPVWLVPVGFFLIPIATGAVILLFGFLSAKRAVNKTLANSR